MSLKADFKNALSSWASGVSVVTTDCEGMLYGVTVSSFSSVSLDPPLILVCLANSNQLPGMVKRSEKFAVSLLAQDQMEASNYFAISGRDPTPGFTEIPGEWSASKMPVIAGCMAYVCCELHEAAVAGDHTILIGRVVEAVAREDKTPLLYFRRGYRSLSLE